MSAQHTTGPWIAERDPSHFDTLSTVTAGENDRLVVQIGGKVTVSEQEANARLISAAPDLLAALTGFVRQWNACGPNSDFGRYFQSVRDAAMTAIAKATGGAA